jgi:hypothetical protein
VRLGIHADEFFDYHVKSGFLEHLAPQGIEGRLADLNASARSCPSTRSVIQPHAQNAAFFIGYGSKDAERRHGSSYGIQLSESDQLRRLAGTVPSSAALMMSSLTMAAMGYLFEIQSHPEVSVASFARKIVAFQWLT